MMAMKHLLIVILLFLNPLLAASTDASTDTLQSCSVQLETLNVKHLAETKLLKAQIKALQSKYEPVNHLPAAKTLISSCDVHLNCASCLAANCGWCLGERACVPDKPWMCQGDEDHVGTIGHHKMCPVVVDVEPQMLAKPPVTDPATEPVTDPVTEPVVVDLDLPDQWDGICSNPSGSGCDKQKICDCFAAAPPRCACGETAGNRGCCNCGCGECKDICRKSAPATLPVGAPSQTTSQTREKEKAAMTREELLRVKLEMEADVEQEAEIKSDGSPGSPASPKAAKEPSEQDKLKCEMVKQRALDKGEGVDDPYRTLNVTDSATTAEIRRSYRKLTLALHPDKHNEKLCGEEAHKAFEFLVAAHDILSDPDKRAAFDQYGDADQEEFHTQWEYEQYASKKTKNFYRGSSHVTNIDDALWQRLTKKTEKGSASRGHKIWLVEFYAPWCSACQKFTPEFKKLAKQLAEHEPTADDQWYGVDVEVGAINCETHQNLCGKEFNIRHYPTLRVISPGHGTQHELDGGARDANSIKDAVYDIASEWLWLFSRASVEEIESEDMFQTMVMDSESFVVVVFIDGEVCGPCRTAKTNALRLSAGLLHSGADVSVQYMNCAKDSVVRRFCTETVGVPAAPHAPQVRGYSAGGRGVKEAEGGEGGEVLYNANEIPPHAALRMIESIVRLSSKLDEEGKGLEGEEAGQKGGFDEGIKEEEDSEADDNGFRPPPREQQSYNKLNWNGPSERKVMGGNGGGGGLPQRHMLGG